MKRTLCLLLALLLAVVCCACGSDGDNAADSEQLTYYYTKEYKDDTVEKIQRYNRWCTSHSTEDMKIKLIEFDNFETMSQRLNIEVMAGAGPDLFSNNMDLPFEHLMKTGAFYDLNELIESDTASDKIDLSAYNQTVMDAGLYEGKRYFLPLFYRVYTLVGEKETLQKFHMPTEQGYHLTFDNMDEVFADYLQDPKGYDFMSGDERSGAVNANTVILRLINSQVDFENQSVSFDEGFKEKLELMSRLREHSEISAAEEPAVSDSKEQDPCLFNPLHSFSNPIYMEFMMSLPDDIQIDERAKDPVLYSCFEKDENTYSAGIVDAIFVRSNIKKEKRDKALAFLKYLLGDHVQNLYTGTGEEYSYGGSIDYLPVLNSAYENCIRDAKNIGALFDMYGISIKPKEELSPVTQALIDHIEKIDSVELYFDLYNASYDKNVAVPILQDYWDGKTNIDKCADNLSSATKIYIWE